MSENEVINIVIYGNPVPQGRPKFARRGNFVTAYDPQRSRNYKQWLRLNIIDKLKKVEGWKPYESAILVDIVFYMGIPTSWGKKKRTEAAQGLVRPTSKKSGDLDNLVKAVQDAGNGLLWVDDSIITDLRARKRYTPELARVEISATEVR